MACSSYKPAFPHAMTEEGFVGSLTGVWSIECQMAIELVQLGESGGQCENGPGERVVPCVSPASPMQRGEKPSHQEPRPERSSGMWIYHMALPRVGEIDGFEWSISKQDRSVWYIEGISGVGFVSLGRRRSTTSFEGASSSLPTENQHVVQQACICAFSSSRRARRPAAISSCISH